MTSHQRLAMSQLMPFLRLAILILYRLWVGLNGLPLATVGIFSATLHSALLHREYGQRIGDS